MMKTNLKPASKLTISIGGDEQHAGHPLYREVLKVLKESGINGATLTKGVVSYGIGRQLHTMMNEVSMGNLPIVIEAVDESGKIEAVAESVAAMLGEHGLVQVQPTQILTTTQVEEKIGRADA